jgi:6-phosphogluconate dehydrogenase (decarboxylating)
MEPNSDDKKMQKIFKLLGKKDPVTFTAEELEKELEKKDDVIDRGMKKYAEEKAEGKEIAQLKKTMFYKEDNVL